MIVIVNVIDQVVGQIQSQVVSKDNQVGFGSVEYCFSDQ